MSNKILKTNDQINYLFIASLAVFAKVANAAASDTAKSANILRLTSIPANFNPCINLLYDNPFIRAAALIRVIHNLRKSRFFPDDGHGKHIVMISLLARFAVLYNVCLDPK